MSLKRKREEAKREIRGKGRKKRQTKQNKKTQRRREEEKLRS